MSQNKTRVFTHIDDDKLIEEISSAKKELFFMCPGINKLVAEELAKKWRLLGADSATIIIDVEADVIRLGYGERESVDILYETAKKLGTPLQYKKGIRLGVLICDDDAGILFTPAYRAAEVFSPIDRASENNESLLNAARVSIAIASAASLIPVTSDPVVQGNPSGGEDINTQGDGEGVITDDGGDDSAEEDGALVSGGTVEIDKENVADGEVTDDHINELDEELKDDPPPDFDILAKLQSIRNYLNLSP